MTIVKDKMGLDPNDADLFLQFENIDLDGSGDIDKQESPNPRQRDPRSI